jgi:hypothetical protein
MTYQTFKQLKICLYDNESQRSAESSLGFCCKTLTVANVSKS